MMFEQICNQIANLRRAPLAFDATIALLGLLSIIVLCVNAMLVEPISWAEYDVFILLAIFACIVVAVFVLRMVAHTPKPHVTFKESNFRKDYFPDPRCCVVDVGHGIAEPENIDDDLQQGKIGLGVLFWIAVAAFIVRVSCVRHTFLPKGASASQFYKECWIESCEERVRAGESSLKFAVFRVTEAMHVALRWGVFNLVRVWRIGL